MTRSVVNRLKQVSGYNFLLQPVGPMFCGFKRCETATLVGVFTEPDMRLIVTIAIVFLIPDKHHDVLPYLFDNNIII